MTMPEHSNCQTAQFHCSYWNNCILALVLSPIIGLIIGLFIFHISMPPLDVSLTVPTSWGDNLGRMLFKQKLLQAQAPYVWKIKVWAWITIIATAIASIARVQYLISTRRRELADNPEVRMAFDRLVAKQEPRAWLLTTFEFLKKLFTPAGQQQLSQFLVDFFTFKIMLVEVLIPLLYFLSLIVAVSKGIEQASLFCLRQGNVGIVAGIAYFVTSAVGYRIFYEQAMTTFSIHSVLRTIKKGII